MISLGTLAAALSIGAFFINHDNRAFVHKHVFAPTGHAAVKVERVIRKPFHRRKP